LPAKCRPVLALAWSRSAHPLSRSVSDGLLALDTVPS
jgi:hypothetical protein